MTDSRSPFSTHGFSVVICRNFDGRWLAVKETRNRGWWLPAGLVDPGESFTQAAHRECLEEANIKIELKGILRIEHSVYGPSHARMRVVFFAIPIDENQIPKDYPDKESEEARWVTIEELRRLARTPPGLRGPELYEWGNYIEKGGMIAPLHFLSREDEPTPTPSLNSNSRLVLKQSETNLLTIIERGDEQSLSKALLSGCPVDISINDKNWTVLHLACKLNQEACVKILLLGGADVRASTHKNRSVLHFAAESTPGTLLNVVTGLCRYPDKRELINEQDFQGDSALHFAAAIYGRTFSWNVLVENGADPHIKNKYGRTPLEVASETQLVSWVKW